jgi:hypothetical protein
MKETERQQIAELIGSLERQIIALKRLGEHSIEIAACEKAIGQLQILPQLTSGTHSDGNPKPKPGNAKHSD